MPPYNPMMPGGMMPQQMMQRPMMPMQLPTQRLPLPPQAQMQRPVMPPQQALANMNPQALANIQAAMARQQMPQQRPMIPQMPPQGATALLGLPNQAVASRLRSVLGM